MELVDRLIYIHILALFQVKVVIQQQSEEWSNLISQQVKEELGLYDVHAPQVRKLPDLRVSYILHKLNTYKQLNFISPTARVNLYNVHNKNAYTIKDLHLPTCETIC